METITELAKKIVTTETPQELLPHLLLGKPFVSLRAKKETVVHFNGTDNLQQLMRIYELAGWNIHDEKPTSYYSFGIYGNRGTCVSMGYSIIDKGEGSCSFSSKQFYEDRHFTILSLGEFYDCQNITPEQINQINKWYENNG